MLPYLSDYKTKSLKRYFAPYDTTDCSAFHAPAILKHLMENKQNLPILEVNNLSVSFQMYDNIFKQKILQAISELNIKVYAGEILAIAGSSGSGKSLLAPVPNSCPVLAHLQ